MKKFYSTFLLLLATLTMYAQTTLVDFDDIQPKVHGGWNGVAETTANPKTDGINTSANTGRYITPAGLAWSNCSSIEFNSTINFSDLEKVEMMVLAPSATQMYVKLENTSGTSKAVECYATPVADDNWQTITLIFSGLTEEEAETATYDKIAIFFNVNDAVGGEEWYYDNLVAIGGIATPEPAAPLNLEVSNITDTSFVLSWEQDELATGVNVYIEDQMVEGSNTYITTLGADATSYTYKGTYDDITIEEDGIYVARIQSLPDADNNAYTQLRVNMVEPVGIELPYDPNFWVFVCFGQSNMEGSAPIEAEDLLENERFKVLQSLDCSSLMRSKDLWYNAVPPLTQCYSQLSPADYFGKEMIANLPDSITIGVLNVSVGGSDIRLFDKDIYQDYDSTYTDQWFYDKIADYDGNPYQHLINLAKKAQESGVIKGILLHQGESNLGDKSWPTYVNKIYNDMLTDLSLEANETPLLAGEVVDEEHNGTCAEMNEIINTLPDTIATAHVICSEGCDVQEDLTHFNSEGVRILGRRYAETMLSIINHMPTAIDTKPNYSGYALGQNQPNPATEYTTITFTIPNHAHVILDLIDITGTKVACITNTNYSAGTHRITYDTSMLKSGVYFYTINSSNFVSSRKMIVTTK